MEQWKELFAFNRTERRGIWLLLILISGIFATDFILSHVPSTIDRDQLRCMLIEGEKQRFNEKGPWPTRSRDPRHHLRRKDSLFVFDPNKLTSREWQLLGLSPKQAQTLVNYVARGGQFRTNEDLKRSFVISEEFFQKVEPFIHIQNNPPVERDKKLKNNAILQININTADTSEWRKLPGIGTTLSSRIIKYREALGGFHSIEQLREVYGLREETIERNRSRLYTDSVTIKKISINAESAKSLASHPYIDRKLAYLLTELRKQAPFSSEKDLRNRIPSEIHIHPHLWPYIVY